MRPPITNSGTHSPRYHTDRDTGTQGLAGGGSQHFGFGVRDVGRGREGRGGLLGGRCTRAKGTGGLVAGYGGLGYRGAGCGLAKAVHMIPPSACLKP